MSDTDETRPRRSRDALAKFDEAFLPADEPAAPVATRPEPTFAERALGGAPNGLDNIDRLFRRAPRRLWLELAAIVLLVVAAVVWAAVADVTVIVRGQALVVPPDGFFIAGEGLSGQIVSVDIDPLDQVAVGQQVAMIAVPGSGEVPVVSPVDGAVVAVDVRLGDLVTGGGVARIAPDEPAAAVGLFGAADLGSLQLGQRVDVTVNGLTPERFGAAIGRVASVGTIPVTAGRLKQLTGDATIAAALGQAGPLYEVVITLDPADTPSGVAWTRGEGPPSPIPLGALALASVTVDRTSLLDKALG